MSENKKNSNIKNIRTSEEVNAHLWTTFCHIQGKGLELQRHNSEVNVILILFVLDAFYEVLVH